MANILKNKKGDVSTIMIIIFFLFGLAFALLIAHKIIMEFVPHIEEAYNDTYSGSDSSDIFPMTYQMIDRMDNVYFILFIGFIIIMVAASFLTPTDPIYMTVFFILCMIFITVGVILSNGWQSYSAASAFDGTITKFPKTDLILDYLPWYIAIISIISMVVLYSRRRRAAYAF